MLRAAQNKRWVPGKALASIAGKAHTPLAHSNHPVSKFYLMELYDVVKATEAWTETIRMTT